MDKVIISLLVIGLVLLVAYELRENLRKNAKEGMTVGIEFGEEIINRTILADTSTEVLVLDLKKENIELKAKLQQIKEATK